MMKPTAQQRERAARRVWWATYRHDGMLCLWDSEADASENCDPDERVIRVRVTRLPARAIRRTVQEKARTK